MDDKQLESIKMHVAGATVQHKSPFDSLRPFNNDFDLSRKFIDEWVAPFYQKLARADKEWIDQLISIKCEIKKDIIQTCLGDFNWRTRQTGAFFAAMLGETNFIDIIGTHLLKSEVCYAGSVYCKVLASFNTTKCVEYLNLYLDYYLSKPDLWFDQKAAMQALLFLDKRNATNYLERHVSNWQEFIRNKPNWEKEISTAGLEKQLAVIETVRKYQC
jgi:hypothetical protein